MPTSTPTPIELSKAAQEQILAAIKQGQEIALGGIELWASAVAPFAKTRREPVRGRPPQAGRPRRELVRLRREAARLAEGVRPEGRRDRGAGPERGQLQPTPRRRSTLADHAGRASPSRRLRLSHGSRGRRLARPTRGARRVHSHPTPARQPARSARWQGSRRLQRLPQPGRARTAPALRSASCSSLAEALNLSAETLLAQAGLIDEDDEGGGDSGSRQPGPAATVAAILADPSLTSRAEGSGALRLQEVLDPAAGSRRRRGLSPTSPYADAAAAITASSAISSSSAS